MRPKPAPSPPFPRTRLKSQDTAASEEHPLPELIPPRPYSQTKIIRNKAQLTQIPVPARPDLIQELYLAHNKISSVQGVLRLFKSLRSLNLSYNQLSNQHELVLELQGTALKRLGIRMNRFEYGYEDDLVRGLVSLEKLQDFQLGPLREKKQIFEQARQISASYITVHLTLEKALATLLGAMQKQGHLEYAWLSHLGEATASLTKFIKKQPSAFLPVSRMVALRSLSQCMGIVLRISAVVDPYGSADYTQQVCKAFSDITQEILMKFSARSNSSLLNSLKNQPTLSPEQSINPMKSGFEGLVAEFGRRYGGRRYDVGTGANNGRYLQKVDVDSSVVQHPLMEYIHYTAPTKNTLCADYPCKAELLEKTPQNNLLDMKTSLFQNIPVIIYERNYLEVLTLICSEKVKELVRVYDYYTNEILQQGIANSHAPTQANFINTTLYLNDDSLEEGRDTVPKEAPTKAKYLGESNNRRQTLGKRNNYQISEANIEQENDRRLDNKETLVRSNSELSFGRREPEYSYNIGKYSMYEINLAFKVLRGLKRNARRPRRRVKGQS